MSCCKALRKEKYKKFSKSVVETDDLRPHKKGRRTFLKNFQKVSADLQVFDPITKVGEIEKIPPFSSKFVPTIQ